MENHHQDGSSTQVVLEAWSEQYAPDYEGWPAQVASLYEAIGHADVAVKRQATVAGGGTHKGASDTVYLLLGSTVALRALTEAFKSWLSRPGGRHVTLTVERAGRAVTKVTVDANNVSDAALKQVLVEAMKDRKNA